MNSVGGPAGSKEVAKRCTKAIRTVGPTLIIRRPSMFSRVMLLAALGTLILCLAGCGGDEEKKAETAPQPAAAPAPAPKPEENVPIYELTKDEVTSHDGWTSRNISVLGV